MELMSMPGTKFSPPLVLASQSSYRARTLQDLGFSFTQIAPKIDERALTTSDGRELSQQLALSKCRKVVPMKPSAVVIACDQVGICEGITLTKPGTIDRAVTQLHECQGKVANFFTSIAVAVPGIECPHISCVTTELKFRSLNRHEIEHYVAIDQPLDCAGAFKIERLGITLFERVKSEDPSALIGLPVIALITILREAGISPLTA